MKIANIEVTKDALIAASAAAAAVAALLIYLTFYAPLLHRLKTTYRQCQALEDKASDVRSRIEDTYAYGERTLITESETSVAIEELTKHGQLKGVNFVSIKPCEIINEPGQKYRILPIEMEIESNDHQLSDFLGSLDVLEKSVIAVKSFNITANKDDRSRLNTKLTVDMYLSGT